MEVNKALMLDYVAPEAEQQRFACERPLDRVLLPLQQASTAASQASYRMHTGSGACLGNMQSAAPVRSTLLTNSGSAGVATLLQCCCVSHGAHAYLKVSQRALTDP